MRPVLKFTEKPDEASATESIRAGGLCSSGIFAGRISRLVALYSQVVPGLMFDLKVIVEHRSDLLRHRAKLASFYARHPSFDFSRDVLQKHPDRLQFLAVPPCGWSDIASVFDRAAFKIPSSHDGVPRSHPDLCHSVQSSISRFAANARLPPHDEK
jgi:mannose-1-phosphate guanylyltransferase